MKLTVDIRNFLSTFCSAAKGGTFLNRIPADLLPFYKQLVPYYPYYSDYVPEDMVHVYRYVLVLVLTNVLVLVLVLVVTYVLI